MYEISNPLVVMYNIVIGNCAEEYRHGERSPNRVISLGEDFENQTAGWHRRLGSMAEPIIYRTRSSTAVDLIVADGDITEVKDTKKGGRVQFNSGHVRSIMRRRELSKEAQKAMLRQHENLSEWRRVFYIGRDMQSIWMVYGDVLLAEGFDVIPTKDAIRAAVAEKVPNAGLDYRSSFSTAAGECGRVCAANGVHVRIRLMTVYPAWKKMLMPICERAFALGEQPPTVLIVPLAVYMQYPTHDKHMLWELEYQQKVRSTWVSLSNGCRAKIIIENKNLAPA